jgi:hypothetical protein
VVPISTAGVVDTCAEVSASGFDPGGGDAAGGGSVGGMTETGAGATGRARAEVPGWEGAGDGGVPDDDASSRSRMCFSATPRFGAVGASFKKRR